MKRLLNCFGVDHIRFGIDFDAFMIGVKYAVDGAVSLDTDKSLDALFFFAGPLYVVFIIGDNCHGCA